MLTIAGVAALVCMVLLIFLRFDFNPLHLQNRNGEAITTVADLMKDPQETPNTIDVLSANLATADALAGRLEKLPQVSQALTLSTFIPSDQTAKLAAVSDADLLLDPTLNPFETQAAPSDTDVVASLTRTAADLNAAAKRLRRPARRRRPPPHGRAAEARLGNTRRARQGRRHLDRAAQHPADPAARPAAGPADYPGLVAAGAGARLDR